MRKLTWTITVALALWAGCTGTKVNLIQVTPEYKKMNFSAARLGILLEKESIVIANPLIWRLSGHSCFGITMLSGS
jgi:hypothetical protein